MSRNLPVEGYRPIEPPKSCVTCGTALITRILTNNGRKEKLRLCPRCTKNLLTVAR